MKMKKQRFVLPNIARCMSPKDRKALGIELPGEIIERIKVRNERELQKLCEQELSRRGIVYLHLSFRAREKRGWPDLTFCLNGHAVAIELKVATKLSDIQREMMIQMQNNGWRYYVIYNFDRFLRLLNLLEVLDKPSEQRKDNG